MIATVYLEALLTGDHKSCSKLPRVYRYVSNSDSSCTFLYS